jgi:hypothetical protein
MVVFELPPGDYRGGARFALMNVIMAPSVLIGPAFNVDDGILMMRSAIHRRHVVSAILRVDLRQMSGRAVCTVRGIQDQVQKRRIIRRAGGR